MQIWSRVLGPGWFVFFPTSYPWTSEDISKSPGKKDRSECISKDYKIFEKLVLNQSKKYQNHIPRHQWGQRLLNWQWPYNSPKTQMRRRHTFQGVKSQGVACKEKRNRHMDNTFLCDWVYESLAPCKRWITHKQLEWFDFEEKKHNKIAGCLVTFGCWNVVTGSQSQLVVRFVVYYVACVTKWESLHTFLGLCVQPRCTTT